ncbi:MAG TPA: TauD/TfdA family dioxygenase [Kofleriaceae bacterium]|nr:TauD/TfdA family dioxygenase [Kofleriaceae bacterium]
MLASTTPDDVPRGLQPFGAVIDTSHEPRHLEELPVDRLREWARTYRVLLLRGFVTPSSGDELAAYARRWGDLMPWPFGFILDVIERPGSPDHVFHSGYLPLHWDGMYVDHIPEFQLFQCVAAPPDGAGGETVFCDTSLVWRDADHQTRDRWRRMSATYRIERITHYGGRVTSPLVVAHARTGEPILRFNEPSPEQGSHANGHTVEVTGIDRADQEAAVTGLVAALHDPRHVLVHSWRTGDVLIADNYTLLHGRTPYQSGTSRHLRRAHVLGSPPHQNPATRGAE